MVAIKILSKEDVIAAYLCSLGFPQSHIGNLVNVVKAKLNLKSDNADELIKEIDVFLLNMAKKVFPELSLDDTQLLTQFKLEFILNNGAQWCSQDGIKNFELPQKLVENMRKNLFFSAPVCHYREMKPQTIESFGKSKRKKK